MRLVACLRNGNETLLAKLAHGYADLRSVVGTESLTLRRWLAAPESDRRRWWEAAGSTARVELAERELLPPISDPRKIVCVGLNYADHAAETGAPLPTEPVIFNKFPSTLLAHAQPIVLPAASHEVDFEGELVVVLGRTGRDIPLDQAQTFIAGYCCGHDVSARDWQKNKPQKQWLLGKSFDTFAPLGPEFVSADEIRDPHQLAIRLRLNGQLMQDSSTSQLIFSIPALISYVSQVCTWEPGDLLFTGTPAGVGVARKPPVFLQPGDQVEVEIEGLGTLANPVLAAR